MDHANNTHTAGYPHPLRNLTAEQFMALGGSAVVFIRPIRGAALSDLMEHVDVEDDVELQLVVAADGSPLLVADSRESVAEWLSDKDIGVVAVH